MEVVWQNAPLFRKMHFFANLFFAQGLYLRYLKISVPKVSKVTVVTRGGPKSTKIAKYYYNYILKHHIL